MKTLLLVGLFFAASAGAQTTSCWSEGNTFTCQTAQPGQTPGQYGYLHDAGKADFANAAQAFVNIATTAAASHKKVKALVIGTKCGQYRFATVTYKDNSGNTVTMSGQVNTADLEQAKSVYPLLQVIDIACDE